MILHCEPSHYKKIFEQYPILKSKYVIGYAVWETDILCDAYKEGIQLLDEVWTCSSYCEEAFAKDFDLVTVVPHVVPKMNVSQTVINRLRRELALPNCGRTFYTIADNRSPRKNLGAAIKAFCALPASKAARFLIKTPAPLEKGMIPDEDHLSDTHQKSTNHR